MYNIRVRGRSWLMWYTLEKRRFLGREFAVGKAVFSCWMSDS
jgi:hypothetical protein